MQAHRSLIDAMPNAVILLDSKGCVEYSNGNASQLLQADIIGQYWRDCVAQLFSPKADDWHEVSLRNGRRVKVDISALAEGNGQLVVLTDLTETRALQQKLSHLQRLSSMGRMVASLAHQIRTPLSAAILYAQNLSRPALDAHRKQRFSEKLMGRLNSLEQQVNDMLLFAKSGDQQVLERVPEEQLKEAIEAAVMPYANSQGVSLDISSEGRADSILDANLTALSGAIQNLVSNAIDASEAGQTVTVELAQHQGEWRCTVSDNGCGISSAVQQKMLTPFETSKTHGTGLGLAVVSTVVKSHQGKLSWESEPGMGSTFSITMPLARDAETSQEVCYG